MLILILLGAAVVRLVHQVCIVGCLGRLRVEGILNDKHCNLSVIEAVTESSSDR